MEIATTRFTLGRGRSWVVEFDNVCACACVCVCEISVKHELPELGHGSCLIHQILAAEHEIMAS